MKGYPPASLAWLVWGLAASLYLVAFYQRVAPAVLTQELTREFALSAAALGNLSAFYFYSYVAVQVPTGLVADRWGPRRLLAAGAAVTAVGTGLFAFAPALAVANAGRMLIGAGGGVAFVCMLKLASHWMAPHRFAFASGAALFVGMMGAALAGVPLRLAADAAGWRGVMAASAAATAVVAIAIWFVVRDDPAERGYATHFPGHAQRVAGASMWSDLREVAGYRNTLLLLVIPGALSAIVLTFAGLWGVPFLTSNYGMTTPEAAARASLLLVTWSISSMAYGPISERMGRRKPLYIGGVVASMAFWAAIVFVPGWSRAAITALIAGVGVSAGVLVLNFALAKESVPARLGGTASGIANMGVMLGGLAMQPLVGIMLDRGWTGAIVDGVRRYDFAAWRDSFALILAWGALSLVLLALTRETRCRQMR